MRCYNCNKLIWFWNKWRKYPAIINITNLDYGKKIYFCSDKCYEKTLWKLKEELDKLKKSEGEKK